MDNNTLILLTGGAGFIGSNIADFLVNKKIKVRILDNLSTGNKDNIKHLIENGLVEFMYGDVSNMEHVRKACHGVSLICHQAALGSVPRSIDDPLNSHISNVNGFLNILLVAKEMNIKRVVYASSSSVYGDTPVLPKVEHIIGDQMSPYAITKYIDELYAKIFTKLYGLECIGLRYFNVFGPRQNPNGVYATVIPKFINLIHSNTQPTINGDGSFSRDFTYVDNVVMANYLSLTTTNNKCYGEVFNVGNGGETTILEMLNKIKKRMDSNIEPIFSDVRIGDVSHTKANIDKAKNMLNYNPLVNFDDGIIRTIDYFV